MTENRKFHGILSLSAASIALSQSMSVKGQPLDQVLSASGCSSPSQNPDIVNLVLVTAHHEEMARLYADHASHSSHASHVSHASHYSGADYSTPSVPATPTPSYPAYNQQQTPPAVTPIPQTNSVNQTDQNNRVSAIGQTNVLSQTNTVNNEIAGTNTALIDFLETRAAEGSSDAQYSLAINYLYGHNGLKKDQDRAELLLELSAKQGNTLAKAKLEQLKQQGAEPNAATK